MIKDEALNHQELIYKTGMHVQPSGVDMSFVHLHNETN